MKRFTAALFSLSALLSGVFIGSPAYAEEIRELLEQRLENNLSYQKALLQSEKARYTLKQLEQVYIPYVQIGNGSFTLGNTVTSTSGPGGPSSSSSTAVSSDSAAPPAVGAELDFALQASFRNVLGADITISEPFSWDQVSGYTPEFPRLSVSRKLFDESGIALIKARASYIQSEHQLQEIEASAFVDLMEDVFDYHYYLQATDVQESYSRNYKRLTEAARDKSSERDFKRQWYTVQKGLLESESVLESFTAESTGLDPSDIDSLYSKMMDLAETWEGKLPDPDREPPDGGNLAALRLSLKAAEREKALWFLPFLPNPTFSAGITYDLEQQAVQWSFGIEFEVDIIDRGERASRSLERKKGITLARLELEDALESDRRDIRAAWKRKEILKLDHQIAELNREEKYEDFQDAEELYEGEFISEEQFQLRRLDYRNAVLVEERAHHLYLLQLLRILQEYNIDYVPPGR